VSVARMHPDDLRDLADLVADRLARLAPGPVAGVVDAKQLAAMLGVTPGFVYEHSAELGAMRLGDGPRARLRFDVQRAREAMTMRAPATPEPPRRRSRRPPSATSSSAPLLPIRGGEA
jgi:phage tail tape-measure protein